MRFSTILFPLAVLASLVLASPVEERATKLTAVASAAKPKGEAGVAAKPRPGAAVHAQGTGATVAKPGTSKRSDYNEFDGRHTSDTLVVFTDYGCSGDYAAYSLPVTPCYCDWTIWYKSLYVEADNGLGYGVFVGPDCDGLFQSCTSSKGLVQLILILGKTTSLFHISTHAITSTPMAILSL
jgi:hypothetical protein